MHICHVWDQWPHHLLRWFFILERVEDSAKSIIRIKKELEIISKIWGAISWFKLVSTVREPDLMHPIIIGPIVQWCSNAVSSITRFHNISIATPSNVINQIKTVWRKMIIQMSFDENWWYCLMAMEHMRGIDWVLCFHYYFHYYMVVCIYL